VQVSSRGEFILNAPAGRAFRTGLIGTVVLMFTPAFVPAIVR
jgi:hypothetical protein